MGALVFLLLIPIGGIICEMIFGVSTVRDPPPKSRREQHGEITDNTKCTRSE